MEHVFVFKNMIMQALIKHWQPSCSTVSVRMRCHGLGIVITRVNYFVEA